MIETFSVFGRNISLYYTFWFLGVVVVLIIGYYLGRQYGFPYSRSMLYVVGAVALGYVLLWGTSWLFGGGKMSGLNFIRIVTFMPLPAFLISAVFKEKIGSVLDFIAPLLAVFHGVTHLGCIFSGCCHGYPAEWGLYSNNAGTVCFPIQPIEALSSIMIGCVLLLMAKCGVSKNWLYAWYLTLFGGTRFLWEFFRDNEKLWCGISELAFHALAAMLIGFVALVAMRLKKRENLNNE